MKKLFLSLLFAISTISFACDNCNVYLNVSPNDYQNSISIYARQRLMFGEFNFFGEMISPNHTGHGNDMNLWGKNVVEYYQTYEARASFYLKERWNTLIVLPFENNRQFIETEKRYQVQGIGDPIILQSYQLINTKRDTTKNQFVQRLSAGAGIKFPLGKTNLHYENGTPNLDLQPGTGSWDLLGMVVYSMKYRFFGLTSNLTAKWNGKDLQNYRYGLSSNLTLNLFADAKIKKSTLRLLGGSYLERAEMDASYSFLDHSKTVHANTGGTVVYANAGLQFFMPKFQFFAEYQHGITNRLNGYTQLLTKNKMNIGITYVF
ncbi:MAG: hypothetical protein IT222_02640 [Crocinitomix sp.]|nr:hypothetical protein [Crocinitomix sp.]